MFESHQLTPKGEVHDYSVLGRERTNVFATCGVDEHRRGGAGAPSVQHARLNQLVAALPPCTVGMGRARVRTLARGFSHNMGHRTAHDAQVRHAVPDEQQARQGRCPRRDAFDLRAVQRPIMRFVPMRSHEEQARICGHRVPESSSSSAPRRSTDSEAS